MTASASGLAVEVTSARRSLLVTATGEVDLQNVDVLRKGIEQAITEANSPDSVVIDLSAVTFMGAAGLKVLIDGHEQCRDQGTPMWIRGVNPTVRRVVTALALDLLLTFIEPVN